MSSETAPHITPIDPILSRVQVTEVTGLPRSSIYWCIEHKGFPKPLELGPRRRGWRQSAVSAWMDSLQPADVKTQSEAAS